ncbi:hypothetical protein FPY71_02110 [Aureimonas fodinaquatilis]|uniref:Uncharacterized protein n=1 Tax=Aureimonas fodinaquatilis TaxID=2565783 RepID=A0A5B0E2W4_9HYPH|nr:hypothetical protein FPY71_02110 [Aureimonas fodinaquatilis]
MVSCTSSSTILTSSNTALVQTRGAPVCGSVRTAAVAQKQAAIETIKAGFDRYKIIDASSTNNVSVRSTAGSYHTTATARGNTYNAVTTYEPGIPIVSGRHEMSISIRMFHENEREAAQAIPAREILGPKWLELTKVGRIGTCAR